MTVITDVLKPIASMSVAELRIFLATPRIVAHAEKWNTKTRKAELIEIARKAHRAAVDAETLADELKRAKRDHPNGGEVTLSEPASRAIVARSLRLMNYHSGNGPAERRNRAELSDAINRKGKHKARSGKRHARF